MIEVYLKDTKLEILNTADLPSGKKFKSRFIQPGLAGYPQQYGNVLITKESLDKFVNTLEGKPVIINHQEVTTKNVADIEVGRVHNVWFNDEDGWYWCDGILTSQNAIDLINDGYSVSCSYNVSDFTDKVESLMGWLSMDTYMNVVQKTTKCHYNKHRCDTLP